MVMGLTHARRKVKRRRVLFDDQNQDDSDSFLPEDDRRGGEAEEVEVNVEDAVISKMSKEYHIDISEKQKNSLLSSDDPENEYAEPNWLP